MRGVDGLGKDRRMMRTQHKCWRWMVASGLFLGALLGHAVGVYIRSDNLPFFDVLGVSIGLFVGCALFLWMSTRS